MDRSRKPSDNKLRRVDKVKFRVPKHQEVTRAIVLVALTSQEAHQQRYAPGIPLRCPVYGGRHPAWSKECPKKSKVLAKAKEAYQFRPWTYEAVSTEEDKGETDITAAAPYRAARDPQQTRISFKPDRV
ncbi:hypothetical protein N657DRAFT_629414 [Parathielavia appendiculata]|uniref:Uncharacterized protein n=1 Tax=Parathielavia appendiculata TaxID=2587402 RepID=A0AAN6U8C8_9PEZI|nr:hypothetical protein N657DRAFT_629414 [Parathielavia appendiculata]